MRDIEPDNIKGTKYPLLILIFTIIYFSSSYYALITNPNGIRNVIIQIGAALLCYMLCKNGMLRIFRVNNRIVLLLLVLIFTYSIDLIRSFEVINDLIVNISVIVIAFLIISTMDIFAFARVFNTVILFLSVCSLLILIASIFSPSIISRLFPLIGYRLEWSIYNCYVSIAAIGGGIRNFSIFWEPGAFQTYLIIAVYFELFINKTDMKKIVVFIICIISTVSITGYIALLFLIIGALFSRGNYYVNQKPISKRKKTILASILIIGVACVFLFIPDDTQLTLFKKLSFFISPKNRSLSSGALYSASVRYNAIIIPLKRFFQSPLIGIGAKAFNDMNITDCHGLATCTPVNWLAQYGVVYAGVFIYGLYATITRFIRGGVSKIFIFLAVILSIMTESYLTSPIIYVIALYSYSYYDSLNMGRQ